MVEKQKSYSKSETAQNTQKIIVLKVRDHLKGVWWIRLLKMRITCNFERTRFIAYFNYGSNFVTLQNLKPEKLIIENNM